MPDGSSSPTYKRSHGANGQTPNKASFTHLISPTAPSVSLGKYKALFS